MKEINMEKYSLTPQDIESGINRILSDAYASSTVSDSPKLIYIVAGPGAGKTSVEAHFRKKLKEKNEKPYTLDSDKIAQFHPNYEDAIEELPEECYRITRQFVRPVAPVVFDELINKKVSIINENVFNKGEKDLEQATKFKKNGYKILVNIMATDLFECRLSCYERDAAMLKAGLMPRGCSKSTQEEMYNCFVDGIRNLQRLGLCDEINVYVRGELRSIIASGSGVTTASFDTSNLKSLTLDRSTESAISKFTVRAVSSIVLEICPLTSISVIAALIFGYGTSFFMHPARITNAKDKTIFFICILKILNP